jgi:hypothetical protein
MALSSQSFTDWVALGKVPPGATVSSPPTVAMDNLDAIHAFARGTDNNLYHWQPDANGTYPVPGILGGGLTGGPAAIRDNEGRLTVFAAGVDSVLSWTQEESPGGRWGPFVPLTDADDTPITQPPSVVTDPNGALEVFARTQDGRLYHNIQQNDGTWPAPGFPDATLSGPPVAIIDGDGRVAVSAAGEGSEVSVTWQQNAGANWQRWQAIGPAIIGPPTAALNEDGLPEVFAREDGDAVFHAAQQFGGGAFQVVAAPEGPVKIPPAAAANSDQRLELVAGADSGQANHNFQTAPGGAWSGWDGLGNLALIRATAILNASGQLDVFARATDNQLYHVVQTGQAE